MRPAEESREPTPFDRSYRTIRPEVATCGHSGLLALALSCALLRATTSCCKARCDRRISMASMPSVLVESNMTPKSKKRSISYSLCDTLYITFERRRDRHMTTACANMATAMTHVVYATQWVYKRFLPNLARSRSEQQRRTSPQASRLPAPAKRQHALTSLGARRLGTLRRRNETGAQFGPSLLPLITELQRFCSLRMKSTYSGPAE